jgi:hypothetical protein
MSQIGSPTGGPTLDPPLPQRPIWCPNRWSGTRTRSDAFLQLHPQKTLPSN